VRPRRWRTRTTSSAPDGPRPDLVDDVLGDEAACKLAGADEKEVSVRLLLELRHAGNDVPVDVRLAFHSSGPRRVRDATYLGSGFRRSAHSPVCVGQNPARPSYVFLPSHHARRSFELTTRRPIVLALNDVPRTDVRNAVDRHRRRCDQPAHS
jgi:hypothetical protein